MALYRIEKLKRCVDEEEYLSSLARQHSRLQHDRLLIRRCGLQLGVVVSEHVQCGSDLKARTERFSRELTPRFTPFNSLALL